MDTNRIKILLQKYKAGEATTEEQLLLENWYARESMLQMQNPEMEDYLRIKNEMWVNMEQQMPVERRIIRLWTRIAAVAAAVALIVLGVYFFNAPSRHPDDRRDLSNYANDDIAPGKNGATITLASGKVIELSDAKSGVIIGDDKVAYNDNTVISSDPLSSRANAKDLVASTAKGQTYEFILPDGTKVWLNAASTLRIPSDFSGAESRKVELTGEAYFEVAKNKKRPFIVKSLGQEVTVLGTHFNINAYADEPSVKTTLLEGSVSVSSFQPSPSSRRGERSLNYASGKALTAQELRSKMSQGAIILKPNEQATLDKDFRIQVQQVQEAERAMAWRKVQGKPGDFYFQNEDLESLMRTVARWYDVEVVYQFKYKRSDKVFAGAVSRDVTLSQMMRVLALTQGFTFKIEGRRLIIMD
ncbi:FecR family protein [Pedobacter frigoris]|uniref:FecR family protein n=1 Tax=Pedobacter frigoris TaxID=2571272 RepID=UPI00292F3A60|nr:FecR domain-containing protein [Pedobacter frigoris]